jgi:molybdopterin converting factor small subunit
MNMTCVDILYIGRPSEFLLTTSERLEVPDAAPTLQQVLGSLRARGARWAYELDERHVMCTVNRVPAVASAPLAAGDEIGIYSRKSIFEA